MTTADQRGVRAERVSTPEDLAARVQRLETALRIVRYAVGWRLPASDEVYRLMAIMDRALDPTNTERLGDLTDMRWPPQLYDPFIFPDGAPPRPPEPTDVS